jgi:hypothetical protein
MSNTAAREPRTLLEAVRYFSDADRSFNFVKDLRWPDGKVTCPRCAAVEPSFLTIRRIWKSKGCRKQFSLKVGTIFEDSPLGWDKWLPAVWAAGQQQEQHLVARAGPYARHHSEVGLVPPSPPSGRYGYGHLPADVRHHRS